MTAREIYEKAKALDYFDNLELVLGEVGFCQSFYLIDGEEVNDAASRTSIDLQHELRRVGLCVSDIDSDNDSVFGTIGEASE